MIIVDEQNKIFAKPNGIIKLHTNLRNKKKIYRKKTLFFVFFFFLYIY